MRSDHVVREPYRRITRDDRPSTATGAEFVFGDPASWGTPDAATTTDTRLYGTATVRAWHRLHPR
ncbi:hypothetical protein [Jidongwangia harbinensis]|uniref:hypothetical protein n=1 Tax=Jidongwangia harbinensis TaxID=2878561 RepID=UPI001CD9A8FB|nr:hypothetical protein [Jidongwangia harbinensis]MCA2218425.1 hypothetical protein [Jidongwangia harbinensis]